MAPHCLLEGGGGTCVECLDDGDCMAVGKLACDADTRTCRNCVEHAGCPGSQACLPEGTCGDDTTVIYVAPTGVDTGTCPVTAPCKTIAFALGRVTETRYHVKLTGVLAETVTIVGKNVVLIADPNTKLTGGATTLKIQDSTVSVYDLEIACSAMGNAVKSEMGSTTQLRDIYVHGCAGKDPAIDAKGGFIGISRARIGECVSGGIATDGSAKFSITNTLVYRNGTAMSKKGAVTIGASAAGTNRFEHNTIVHNTAKTGPNVAGGVGCTLTNLLEMPHNIIAGNTTTTGIGDNTIGGCNFGTSSVTADTAAYAFKSEIAPYDYHITAGSSAIDKVDVSTVADDVDSEFRPQGPRKDLGADELRQ